MNEDSSTYEIPEYIDSRLNPKIFLDFPEAKDEFEILKYNVPYADSNILNYIVAFLQEGHQNNKTYSVRDGINMARYYMKLVDAEEKNYADEKPEEEKKEEETEYFYPDLFELSIRQILDDDAIDFFNRRILDTLGSNNGSNIADDDFDESYNNEKSGALGDFLDDTVDYEDYPDKKVNKNEGFSKFKQGDVKFGEFSNDTENLGDDNDKFLDSENDEREGGNLITFLDEEEKKKKRKEEKDDFYVGKSDVHNPNSEYLRDLKKKIRANLKKIKSEEKKTKKSKKKSGTNSRINS